MLEHKKPLIGILPLWDDKRESFWMLPGYPEGVSEAGGLPVILPLTEEPGELRQLVAVCDGFLFTGGHDVSPWVYGAEQAPETTQCCERRDRMEAALLELAIETDTPVLGICRGIQIINAALGGTLYQHIPRELPSGVEHHMKPPYDVVGHQVTLVPNTPLWELLGLETLGVNSFHHQGVKDTAPGLTVMARAEDGLVEALYRPESHFLWAVQWHPEYSHKKDANSRKIFSAFVQAAGGAENSR
ncbi:MAG: gamma-glutamyl-gamma-aminobutyrate hydrolase family protein [Oscillospiraceae bacterium]|nr:gamma-glutamyl-gamma-aminobutyrate hydrolase family protein [Oscillospiraceae bacterium]